MKFARCFKISLISSLIVILSACGGASGSIGSPGAESPSSSSVSSSVFASTSSISTKSSSSKAALKDPSLDTLSSAAIVISSAAAVIAPASSLSSAAASSVVLKSSKPSAASDTQAPNAQIMFPTAGAMTEGNSILVRGSASDDLSEIASVQVNGIEVTTTDHYATWQVEVPLAMGLNSLTVSTRDAANNTSDNAAKAELRRELFMYKPKGIAIDELGKRALVVDVEIPALLAIDLATGLRTVLSSNSVPNNSLAFVEPTAIALDKANGRALVIDNQLQAVIAVDVVTGARSILASLQAYTRLSGITLDIAHNRALVVTALDDRILAVDLTTGAVSTLASKSTIPSEPTAIAIDTVRNRALVTDVVLRGIFAVDLATGKRAPFSDNKVPRVANAWHRPVSIVIDQANNIALVGDEELSGAVSVDLATGERGLSKAVAEKDFISAASIALDLANQRLLAVNPHTKAVIAVDRNSGKTSVLTKNTLSSEAYPFSHPIQIALDSAHNRALVLDLDIKAVIAVDIKTGERSIFSDNATANSTVQIDRPSLITLDAKNNRALMIDAGARASGGFSTAVVAVDLTTGARRILSEYDGGESVPIGTAGGMLVDYKHNRVLVPKGGWDGGVVAVDLTTGARSIVSDAATPNHENRILGPSGMALDLVNNRLLVEDAGNGHRIVGVDLTSGARTLVSLSSGYEQLGNESSIASDPNSNAALVAIGLFEHAAIFKVDLADGTRKLLSGSNFPHSANRLAWPVSMAVDEVNGRALVLDQYHQGILAVDVVTGERVYVSK